MLKDVYLDNAATTNIDILVAEYMNKINRTFYGNPSSLHKKGLESERIIKESRNIIANSLGISDNELIFTSGGTESNNLAIIGYIKHYFRNGNHIITSEIEHPSVLEVYKYLGKSGYDVDIISVDKDGYINLDELKSKIVDKTILISLIFVNNEIGTIQKVSEIVKIKNSINTNVAIHIDGVQGYGKIQLFPKKMGIDMLSISSHKINGPKGIGALYIRNGIRLQPIIFGGGQENKIRSGTENVSAIGGFGLAAKNIIEKIDETFEYVKSLKKYFIDGLNLKELDFTVVSCENASPYILSIGFSNIKAEVLLHHLETYNIFVSTGSACSSRNNKKSHVIIAIDVDRKYIDGIIRFSFSKDITYEDLDITVNVIYEIISKISIKRGVRR